MDAIAWGHEPRVPFGYSRSLGFLLPGIPRAHEESAGSWRSGVCSWTRCVRVVIPATSALIQGCVCSMTLITVSTARQINGAGQPP